MIKDLQNAENLTMNIVLKDGSKFEGKDIPSRPFGDRENFVSFWVGNVVRMYPIADVEYIELVPNAPSSADAKRSAGMNG